MPSAGQMLKKTPGRDDWVLLNQQHLLIPELWDWINYTVGLIASWGLIDHWHFVLLVIRVWLVTWSDWPSCLIGSLCSLCLMCHMVRLAIMSDWISLGFWSVGLMCHMARLAIISHWVSLSFWSVGLIFNVSHVQIGHHVWLLLVFGQLVSLPLRYDCPLGTNSMIYLTGHWFLLAMGSDWSLYLIDSWKRPMTCYGLSRTRRLGWGKVRRRWRRPWVSWSHRMESCRRRAEQPTTPGDS